ncbi:hypothetical protein BOO86_25580 [Mycobacterium sp. CBMA 234]|nr:hypothetical protein [Mycolicibacterium sp. CBMA 234]
MGTMIGQWAGLPVNGAAFLLQAMHPVIGSVVDRYSVYDTDPMGRAIRSFDAVQQWVFGGKAAIEQGYWLRKMHRPLQMTTPDGQHITALHPQAYAWVIATAFPSTVWSAPLVLGRKYTETEEDELYQDMLRLARITQVPKNQLPASRAEFWPYFDKMVDEVLENTYVANNIVHNLSKNPPLRVPHLVPQRLRPAVKLLTQAVAGIPAEVMRLTLIGCLPTNVREKLEVSWSQTEERELQAVFRVYRGALKALPERITYAPLAYHARKHQRIVDTMRKRELTDFTAHDKHDPTAKCPF